ncbi:hypothetical protein [Novosphingobium sp.]|uniref:hypothetical protein n=1 Tax=Novosphingobium sp. TaxID=1874826 RepID=UPI003565C6EB
MAVGERRITADGRILELQADGSVIEVPGGNEPQGVLVKPAPAPPPPPEPKAMQAPEIKGYVFDPNSGQYRPSNVPAPPEKPKPFQAPNREGFIFDPNTGQYIPANVPAAPQKSNADLELIRNEAIDKIRLARSLRQRSRTGLFTTGLGAGLARNIGGTAAYDVNADVETLKSAGALQRIMELAQASGGKNPLTPLSNSDFKALSDSLANLDTAQSDEQFERNVKRVEDLYERAFRSAGGGDLEAALQGSGTGNAINDALGAQDFGVGANPEVAAPGGSSMTERDREVQAALQRGFNAGLPQSELQGIAQQFGYSLPEGFDKFIEARDRGQQGIVIGTPETGQGLGILGQAAMSPLGAAAVGTGNILGGVDELVGGIRSLATGAPLGQSIESADIAKQLIRQESPIAFGAGELLGNVGASVAAARRIPALLARPVAAAAGEGSLYGVGEFNQNRLGGAAIGGISGGGGGLLGRGVLAPLITRGLESRAGQAFMNAPVVNRLTGGAPNVPPALPRADRTVMQGIDGQVMPTLQEAMRLGLPMALADVNPQLRSLAGAATRRSPAVREFAEQTIEPRQAGQAERAIEQIGRNLTQPVDTAARADELIQQGRTAAGPLYDQAYNAPVILTPELRSVLGTPAGSAALGRARTIAGNNRTAAMKDGFALDADGNVVLNPVPVDAYGAQAVARAELTDAQQAYKAARASKDGPSMEAASARVQAARDALREADNALQSAPRAGTAATVPGYTTETLDYVKRGLDDLIEQQRNPITGKLVLDEYGRSLNNVRASLVPEIDRLNPAYRQARQAYEPFAKQAEALGMGQDAFRTAVPPANVQTQFGRLPSPAQEQYRAGFASAMGKAAEDARLTSNPYAAIYGSPNQQAKVGALFPEGSQAFNRAYELERQMSKTAYETLGGSPTAARARADEAFDSQLPGLAADAAATATTGVPVMPNLIARGVRAMADSARVGIGTKRADAIGPTLLDTNTAATIQRIQQMQAMQAEREAFEQVARRRGGIFGAISAPTFAVPFSSQ